MLVLLVASVLWLVGAENLQIPQPKERIVLMPSDGRMVVNARVSLLDNQVFGFNVPETIGCREIMMIVNHPDPAVKVTRWSGPGEDGAVSMSLTITRSIEYRVRIVPSNDCVDVDMTITNLSRRTWHDVFAFNCISPSEAPTFKDKEMSRTYVSVKGQPTPMDKTKRVIGPRPTVGVYLPEGMSKSSMPPFAQAFQATSLDGTDGSWMVTLSDPSGSYMATTSPRCAYLFNNREFCCIHSAPLFGNIGPGESSTVVSRVYFAKGGLDEFLKRLEADKPDHVSALAAAKAFLDAWVGRRKSAGLALVTPVLKQKKTDEFWQNYLVGLSNPHHESYEIGSPSRISDGRWAFEVRLREAYTGDNSFQGGSPKSRIILVQSKSVKAREEGEWLVDELP